MLYDQLGSLGTSGVPSSGSTRHLRIPSGLAQKNQPPIPQVARLSPPRGAAVPSSAQEAILPAPSDPKIKDFLRSEHKEFLARAKILKAPRRGGRRVRLLRCLLACAQRAPCCSKRAMGSEEGWAFRWLCGGGRWGGFAWRGQPVGCVGVANLYIYIYIYQDPPVGVPCLEAYR